VFILAGEVPGDTAHDALFHVLIRPASGVGFGMVGGGAGKGPLGDNIGFTAIGFTLKQLLPSVYRTPITRILVQGKLPEGSYDVVAKCPRTAEKEFDAHLRRAVESTFGLRSLREAREMDVYVITVAQRDAKGLMPTKSSSKNSSLDGGNGGIDGVSVSFGEVLPSLENALSLPVIDETGLKGSFDVRFRWDPAGGPEAIVKDAREQLGLTLTKAKRPIELTVIEASP